MNIRHLFQTATLLAVMVLASCTTPKNVVYFQDIKGGENVFANAATDIRLQKGDKVSIIVKTKDAQLTNLFNLPVTSQILGQTKEQSMLTPSGTSGYTVDAGGNIDFPIVGSIHNGIVVPESIEPADVPTIYLCGNSTVVDQATMQGNAADFGIDGFDTINFDFYG